MPKFPGESLFSPLPLGSQAPSKCQAPGTRDTNRQSNYTWSLLLRLWSVGQGWAINQSSKTIHCEKCHIGNMHGYGFWEKVTLNPGPRG